MAEPVDPMLPARLRRLAFVARSEKRIADGWFRSAQRLTDEIRDTVMGPFRSSGGSLPPDANQAFGTGTQSLWDRQIDQNVIPRIRDTIRAPYDATMSGAPEVVRRSYDADPNVIDHIFAARNRLTRFPNELYALIQRLIARGVSSGSSIPDIAADVQRVLTTTGNDTYRNRAVTVARTETISATNAGALAAAQEMASITGDPNPQKVWLATDDERTRAHHRIADGQRVPLSEPFSVGGFNLAFPGDPSGPPQEVINCRCTVLSVAQGEELDWTDRQFRQDAEDVWADFDLSSELENEDG